MSFPRGAAQPSRAESAVNSQVSFATAAVRSTGPAQTTLGAASTTTNLADSAPSVDPSNPVKPAFDALEYYVKRAPTAQYVSLQGFELTDLVPLMGHLAQLRDMRSLNLAHNALWRLPENMSALSSIETLDLTRNRFASASLVLKGLFSLPRLRHLKIQLPESEEEQLVAQLSTLVSLNGVVLDGSDAQIPPGHAPTADATSTAGREADEPDVPPGVSAAEAARMAEEARHAARESARLRQLESTRGYDTSAPETVASRYKLEPWTGARGEEFRRVQTLASKVAGKAAAPQEADEYQQMVLAHLRAKLRAEADPLKQQVHQFHAETLMLEYANEEVARSSAKYGPELHAALRALTDTTARVLQHASTVMMALQDDRDRKVAALQKDLHAELIKGELTSRVQPADPANTTLQDFAAAMRDESLMAQRKGIAMDVAQLKATIRQIIDSKSRHDRANLEASLPKETMEQHLYTFFTSRFDTKEAVRSGVASVLSSISTHSKSDLDVAVFGRILHQDIDEGYWTVHETLKAAVYDAVFDALSATGPERGGGADVINGVLNEAQAAAVLEALFPQQDVGWRLRGVVAVARRLAEERGDDPSLSQRTWTIGYREFAFTVLRQELHQRVRDVEPVVRLFRDLDRERAGVIDGVQMRMLIDELAPGLSGEKEQQVLRAVDPHSNNIVLFSDAVAVLARYHDAWWLRDRWAPQSSMDFVGLANARGGSPSPGRTERRQTQPAEVPSLYDDDVRGVEVSRSTNGYPAASRQSPARVAASTLGRKRR